MIASATSVLALLLALAESSDVLAVRRPAHRLDDQRLWAMVRAFSEQDGHFPADNILSNERAFQSVIPELIQIARPGGIYLGVGPEQNFTYIAALRPSMAFVIDIRRGNLNLHLLYTGLFRLSADRADFVSRLFSRPRLPG